MTPWLEAAIAGGIVMVLGVLFKLHRDIGENTGFTKTILNNHLPHIHQEVTNVSGDVKELRKDFLQHLFDHANGTLRTREEDKWKRFD
jgi:hypothetical protein